MALAGCCPLISSHEKEKVHAGPLWQETQQSSIAQPNQPSAAIVPAHTAPQARPEIAPLPPPLPRARAYLDEGLLHLHGIEAVEGVDDVAAGLGLVVQPRHVAQPVHAPGLVPVPHLMHGGCDRLQGGEQGGASSPRGRERPKCSRAGQLVQAPARALN